MGTLYVDTGGATTNSGCTDQNAANLSGSNATVAGSVVTLDGSPDLSGLIISGATQSTIHLSQATNSNMKIFWITNFDNVLKTVTVHAAPTGVTGSAWTIGGRHVLTNASIEGAVRAGDTVIFNNSPASSTAARWTFRNAGDVTNGFAKIMGKTGVRPVLTVTGGAARVVVALAWCWIENLELAQTGTLDGIIIGSGAGTVLKNLKVAAAGANAIICGGAARIYNCDISAGGGYGIGGLATGQSVLVEGCYIHDCSSDGIINNVVTSISIEATIVDSCAGRGILISSAHATNSTLRTIIKNCTVYGCGDSGLEVTDIDSVVSFTNNIFMNNGDAAGEYNVEFVAGGAETSGYHAYNCFYKSSNNLSNVTADATDITTDPLFIDAANGDFRLNGTSPCIATGYPGTFLNGSVGYTDMGAVQQSHDYPAITDVKTGTIYGHSAYTGTYDGSDRWTDPGVANVRLATAYKANSTTNNKTGTVRVPAASKVESGYAYDASDSVTGTLVLATYSDPGTTNVRLGTSYIYANSTQTGSLNVPTAASGTAGTVDINNIKETIRYIINEANTTTGSPIDLSSNMTQRVKSVLKINPEKLKPDANLHPCVTVFTNKKSIQMKTIAKDQVNGKRKADITFTVVGIVWNDYTTDYREDPADEDLENLMENLEVILRHYATLNNTISWQIPTDITYHTVSYGEDAHLRIGVMDLQASLFY